MDITSTPAEHQDRGIRRASWIALALLVPVVVGAGLVTLSTTRASGCVTYGVECADVPDGSIPGSFLAALLLGILAVAWPRKLLPFASARGWLLGLHGAAQLMTAALILSFA
ncbi:hypothetical protein [Streptomyces sp. NBC_01363]|uniref:hypothetical protein n=1 Tax=Streptomyces sp. NBC_01363 TaxID=2903840 RepID=UPI00225BEBAC|nr:hypothetical protein [Streptomyces sp. NBC_01363]MCX4732852.1 hypothetical protein [Streptomyces sp. NBC_01363]